MASFSQGQHQGQHQITTCPPPCKKSRNSCSDQQMHINGYKSSPNSTIINHKDDSFNFKIKSMVFGQTKPIFLSGSSMDLKISGGGIFPNIPNFTDENEIVKCSIIKSSITDVKFWFHSEQPFILVRSTEKWIRIQLKKLSAHDILNESDNEFWLMMFALDPQSISSDQNISLKLKLFVQNAWGISHDCEMNFYQATKYIQFFIHAGLWSSTSCRSRNAQKNKNEMLDMKICTVEKYNSNNNRNDQKTSDVVIIDQQQQQLNTNHHSIIQMKIKPDVEIIQEVERKIYPSIHELSFSFKFKSIVFGQSKPLVMSKLMDLKISTGGIFPNIPHFMDKSEIIKCSIIKSSIIYLKFWIHGDKPFILVKSSEKWIRIQLKKLGAQAILDESDSEFWLMMFALDPQSIPCVANISLKLKLFVRAIWGIDHDCLMTFEQASNYIEFFIQAGLWSSSSQD